MSSGPVACNSGALVALMAPELQNSNILYSSSSSYSVVEFIGEGCFGKVSRCQNMATKETVAVKILKDTDYIKDIQKEVSMLELISVLNPDRTSMVKFFEQFRYMGQTCLVFEMLDRNLYDLLEENKWKPLSLNEIRPIAKQVLVALDALRDVGILHTDIKPDNIMFVNSQDQPLKVKLIDFGEAIRACDVQSGMQLQPIGFRAPEIALGLPFTEAIDVWGVGCILAFLYLADNLFPVECDFQMMKCMVEVLGQPEDHLLHAGKYTRYFFKEVEAADWPTWRLMTPEEYRAANQVKPQERNSFFDLPSSLDGLINIYPRGGSADVEDSCAFVDLLKRLLHLDGNQRISAHQALQQPFITMAHLTAPGNRAYLSTSQVIMSVCPVEDSPPLLNTSASVPSPRQDDSDSWLSEGELPSDSCVQDLDAWSSDGELHSPSFADAPATQLSCGDIFTILSEEDLASCSYDEDPPAGSFDAANATDCLAAASASSGSHSNLQNRMRRFLSRITARFCCCWRPTVED